MFKKNKLTATVCAVVMSTPVVSFSNQLEEIIVTATKRAERLQDIPISVTTISGGKIQSAGIERIEDLSVYVPNFTMAETGIGTNIYIRGIGSGINQGFEQSVGMYVDGVYYGRAQLTRAPFLDLERVEVLRGPQSIVLGKNSVAGAINITTAKPTDEFEAELSLLYEPELNENKSRIILNAPFSDTVRGRLAAQYREVDNHIENITEGSDDPGREEETVRATLAWDMTENLTATFKAERGKFDVTGRNIEIIDDIPSKENQDTGIFFPLFPSGTEGLTFVEIVKTLGVESGDIENVSLDGKRSSNGDYSNNDTDNLTLTFEYNIGGYTLTSVTSYMGYEFDEKCDCDFTGAHILDLYSDEEFDQRSQEFRLASPIGERFDFLAGLYYQSNELDYNESLTVGENSLLRPLLNQLIPIPGLPQVGDQVVSKSVDRVYSSDTDSYSAFVQGTFHLIPSVDLTLGLRYSKEDKEGARTLTFHNLDGSPIDDPEASFSTELNYALIFGTEEHEHEGEREEEHWLPSIELEWKLTDNSMLYATYKEGAKAGGFDARSNASVDGQSLFASLISRGTFEYEDEKTSSYEIGTKLSFLDNRLELNMAVYETEYTDLQVSIFDGEVGFNVGNAGGAKARGVEIDGRWLATSNLLVGYSVAYSDFEFTDFKNGQCYLGQEPDVPADTATRQPDLCVYDGKTNQYVAPYTASLTTQYQHGIGETLMFKGALDIIYNDEFLLSQNLDPSVRQDEFHKINGSLSISDVDNTWELALIAKNITDETTLSYANEAPVAVGTFKVGSHYAFVQPPRTVAIQGTYRF